MQQFWCGGAAVIQLDSTSVHNMKLPVPHWASSRPNKSFKIHCVWVNDLKNGLRLHFIFYFFIYHYESIIIQNNSEITQMVGLDMFTVSVCHCWPLLVGIGLDVQTTFPIQMTSSSASFNLTVRRSFTRMTLHIQRPYYLPCGTESPVQRQRTLLAKWPIVFVGAPGQARGRSTEYILVWVHVHIISVLLALSGILCPVWLQTEHFILWKKRKYYSCQ